MKYILPYKQINEDKSEKLYHYLYDSDELRNASDVDFSFYKRLKPLLNEDEFDWELTRIQGVGNRCVRGSFDSLPFGTHPRIVPTGDLFIFEFDDEWFSVHINMTWKTGSKNKYMKIELRNGEFIEKEVDTCGKFTENGKIGFVKRLVLEYKCDGFDGLVQFLTDIGFIN